MEEQRHFLGDIKDQLDDNNKQIRAGNSAIAKIIGSLSVHWTPSLALYMKNIMQDISVTSCAIHKVMLHNEAHLPGHLDRCLDQAPFILEDSHGRIRPFHMNSNTSWDFFDAILEVSFRGMPGHSRVQQQNYVLHDSTANRDVDRLLPWENLFLLGRKYVMCVVFRDLGNWTLCTNCYFTSPRAQDSEIQW